MWRCLSRTAAEGFREYFDNLEESDRYQPPPWDTYKGIGTVHISNVPAFPKVDAAHDGQSLQNPCRHPDAKVITLAVRRLVHLQAIMHKFVKNPSMHTLQQEACRLWVTIVPALPMHRLPSDVQQWISDNTELIANASSHLVAIAKILHILSKHMSSSNKLTPKTELHVVLKICSTT